MHLIFSFQCVDHKRFFDASSCYKSNEKVIHFWQKKLCFPENQHFEKINEKWKLINKTL